MHLEILNSDQKALIPFLKKYSHKYYLVGGTAIAMHLGHRESIDFDMFTFEKINFINIKNHVSLSKLKYKVINQKPDQIHFVINNVKLTFFRFPFKIDALVYYEKYFRIPNLLTLAGMKAFALGHRGKWKDYVDLYFILKNHFTIKEISNEAIKIFGELFNPILFTKQLSYFGDMNYDEEVFYLPGFEVSDEEVKSFLVEKALEDF